MASSGWADMTDDILFLLVERAVGVTTFVRLSVVCKSWYSVASATKCCNPVPWLMLGERKGSELRDFYDLSTGELYQFNLQQAQGMKIVGSADHGWLITASGRKSDHLYLLNPLNGTRITLPYEDEFPCPDFRDLLPTCGRRRKYCIVRVTCSPIEPSSDYIVVAHHMGYSHVHLSFCRSTDEEWSCIDLEATAKSVGFVGDSLIVVSYSYEIYSINFSTPTPSFVKIATIPSSTVSVGYKEYQFYIMECAGAILVVSKTCDFTGPYPQIFEVFKLDVEGKQVIKLETLGDHIMFLGTSYSVCLPITSCMKSIFKRNCIYFIDDRNELKYRELMEWRDDMNVFNLEDGSISIHYPGRVPKLSHTMPVWTMVNDLRLLAGWSASNDDC